MKKIFLGLLFISTTTFAQEITAEKVVQNYINAIGGAENWGKVKDMAVQYEISAMGQNTTIDIAKRSSGSMKMVTSVEGMGEVSKIVFNGEKAKVTSMGNEQMIEGEKLEDIKKQSTIVPEMSYLGGKFQIALLADQEVEGEICHVISVEFAEGNQTKEYYSKATGLKKRMDASMNGMDVVTIISNYKDFEPGVKVAMLQKQEVMGQSFDTVTTSVKLNSGIADSEFEL